MTRSISLVLHGTFWIILGFLALFIFGISTYVEEISQSSSLYFIKVIFGVFVVPAVFSFYIFYTFLFNKYLTKRKVYQSLFYGLILVFVGSLLGNFTLIILLDFPFSCLVESNFISIPIMMFVGIIFGSMALVFRGFLTWFKEIRLKEELLEKNHKTEMALVKSQLDPHFLFNTINNIDILILKRPEEASSYLNKLSDIMRFMLFETKTNKIPIENELLYIEKYIELQKIRTSNSRYVSYNIAGKAVGKFIAPMVFIPFIENAFKYASNKKMDNAIVIDIQILQDQVELNCINKYNPFNTQKVESHGLGNELIKKRLQLLYPDNHLLSITQENNKYQVHLTIPYEEI